MAIARKASGEKKVEPVAVVAAVPESQIFNLIDKGLNTAPAASQSAKNKAMHHPLKFPEDGALWQRLETARKSGMLKTPRNTFILQAILEKLEREGA